MKRTHFLIEKNEDGKYEVTKSITCTVVGEMVDGAKVWENVDNEDDEQYWLTRVGGQYYFVHF